jgi:hypothetical protein
MSAAASNSEFHLTSKALTRALAMLTINHPHHAELIRQHRSKIKRAVLNGETSPEMEAIPYPVKKSKEAVKAIPEMKTEVNECFIAVVDVISSHTNLLLGLLGAVGIDVLEPVKKWFTTLAAPVIDYLKTTADEVLKAVAALDKAKKFALFISACVAGGLLAYIWDSIKNWSWWQWIKAVAGWTATIVGWLGSGMAILIAQVVKIILNAINLFEAIKTMIKDCGPPKTPGKAPAIPNYTYWSTEDIGQGSGFVNMQMADIDGDGKKEVIQFWNNQNNMGAIVYQWNGSALVTKWSTDNIGQGSGFVSLQTADVDADGKKEIIQFWNNRDKMGAIVYQWNGSGLVTKWCTDNIGQGSGFVSMQHGDIDGDKNEEIIQFWNNQNNMGAIVYQWNGSALVTKWCTDNIGQGSGFVSMQIADIDGDESGKKEIIQFWSNGGNMGAIVYQWNGSGLVTKWGTDNIGQGSGFVSMQHGDIYGHKYDEMLQLWNNSGNMAIIMYDWSGSALETIWDSDLGQGSGYVKIQIGDITGDHVDEVVQWWNNGGQMAAIVYAPGMFGKVIS